MEEDKYTKQEGINCYDQFDEYAKFRISELESMLQPYIEATDEYGRIISRITLILGYIAPRDFTERIQRDLFCDVFDFLYETRPLIIKGKYVIAYPLIRRAFESLTLMIACYFDKEIASKWNEGKHIPNRTVREVLDKNKHKGGEPIEETKKLYDFFSNDSHPNNFFIPQRCLGEGNTFVLGSIGIPNLISLVEHCMQILDLWFWFGADLFFYNKEYIDKYDQEFKEDYIKASKKIKETKKWLYQEYHHLIEEYKEKM